MNVSYEHENSDVYNADHFEISLEPTGTVIGFDKVNWLKSRKNGVDEKNMPKTLFVKPKATIELPHGVALNLAKVLIEALTPKKESKQEQPALPAEAIAPLAQMLANNQNIQGDKQCISENQ